MKHVNSCVDKLPVTLQPGPCDDGALLDVSGYEQGTLLALSRSLVDLCKKYI